MGEQQREHSGAPARAVVVSASVGAGHDAAAAEIARRLGEQGFAVDRHDFLDLMPGRVGRLVCESYHRMLSAAPWAYRALYGSLDRSPALSLQVCLFSMLSSRRMRAAIPSGVRLVVSTYPLASQALGRLRLARRLGCPVATYLTDFSVHRLWVADGVDAHLAIHPVAAGQAAGLRAAAVATVRPVTDPRFGPGDPARRAAARARFGLPAEGAVALLVGGSWGAGRIEEAVREVEATGLVRCAVVCGRNEELRGRLAAAGARHVFGWVEDMPGLMHAADVLVQNAGGMTVLEAVASGLPVVTYRCIPGHGRTNAAALDAAGVARWARSRRQLRAALAEALRKGRDGGADPWAASDPVEVLMRTASATDAFLAAAPECAADAGRAGEAHDPAADSARGLIPGQRRAARAAGTTLRGRVLAGRPAAARAARTTDQGTEADAVVPGPARPFPEPAEPAEPPAPPCAEPPATGDGPAPGPSDARSRGPAVYEGGFREAAYDDHGYIKEAA